MVVLRCLSHPSASLLRKKCWSPLLPAVSHLESFWSLVSHTTLHHGYYVAVVAQRLPLLLWMGQHGCNVQIFFGCDLYSVCAAPEDAVQQFNQTRGSYERNREAVPETHAAI